MFMKRFYIGWGGRNWAAQQGALQRKPGAEGQLCQPPEAKLRHAGHAPKEAGMCAR